MLSSHKFILQWMLWRATHGLVALILPWKLEQPNIKPTTSPINWKAGCIMYQVLIEKTVVGDCSATKMTATLCTELVVSFSLKWYLLSRGPNLRLFEDIQKVWRNIAHFETLAKYCTVHKHNCFIIQIIETCCVQENATGDSNRVALFHWWANGGGETIT